MDFHEIKLILLLIHAALSISTKTGWNLTVTQRLNYTVFTLLCSTGFPVPVLLEYAIELQCNSSIIQGLKMEKRTGVTLDLYLDSSKIAYWKPLQLKRWDDTTCKFIDIYEKFPLLYDGEHPLYGKYEDKQKAISDMQNILLSKHDIDFNEEILSDAIDQLHSWYYTIKRRKNTASEKLGKCHENYLKMCKFLPKKRLKVKIVCSICNRNFHTEHNFKYHLSKIHQIGDYSFQCDQCGKKFVSKSALQCHDQRVHCEKKYPCEFCGKLFAIPSELKIHTFVHTAEKPHVCELCGKGFRLRNNLGLHVTRMHTKIRAFKCTMCPKDFLKNCDLKDHIKTHLNIRDKICETCGKGFTNCHSLIRHRQIHSEVKKFACKLCDAKFHQFVGLNGHMKRTHNIVKKDGSN